jgi:hypothetical protein
MAEYIVQIGYRTSTGAKQEMTFPCDSLEQAEQTREEWAQKINDDPWDRLLYAHIKGKTPEEKAQEQPTEPTHYKLTAKGISGGYYTAVLPITEDLDKAIDSMEDDLILIGVERISLPVKKATSMVRTRLHMRLSNNN